jgi:4-amino-4-deoxy-L-arabinose transferase-like glycosyltransferase
VKRLTEWLVATPERRICLGLIALCAMVYVPLAGNYGMWDPWETHYGEVARQMIERNDWVSLWWPGSPQDRVEFWSKPVLTFWIMGLSMKLAGLEWGHPAADEMVSSWRVEWASRMPFIILGIIGVWATWELVRRLAGRRAGLLAAVVLATSSQWLFITRQAMTDMAFVTPMTVALVFAALGLLLPIEERERELPRRALAPGFSYPAVPAFYVVMAVLLLSAVPQLAVISAQLRVVMPAFGHVIHFPGVIAMLPYIALFGLVLFWCFRAPIPVEEQSPRDSDSRPVVVRGLFVVARYLRYKHIRNLRELYMLCAWCMCALATLAKGPAGLAMPALVLAVYLVLAGRWKDIFLALELPIGIAIFIAVGFPWYHAMLIRHGFGFWNEFIGDNYVRRAEGRHGDRGTFEYYLQYIGYGMFPWSGIVTLGALFSFKRLREAGPRGQLAAFALVWLLVEVTVLSLVNTKFHHYILPALPALAVLAGLFLDELLRAPSRAQLWGMALIALPITFMCGRDLSAFPPRLLWLFNYDYVNAPGTGRPWPLPSIYQDRYEYNGQILVFAILATLAVAGLTLAAWRTRREVETAEETAPLTGKGALVGLGALAIALVASIATGPSTATASAMEIGRWAWLAPTALMLPFVWLLARSVTGQRARARSVWLTAALAVAWSGFLLDKLLIELSPHWAQKHVIGAYYANRRGPEEPLIAWQLYWRGENFYSRNEIYRSPAQSERTVFLGDHNAEKLQQYLTAHRGRRVFFVVERVRLEALRNLLPVEARPTLQVVDQSNNKLYLASAQIGESTPVTPSRSERVPDGIH